MLAKKYRFHGYGSLRYVNKNGLKSRNRFFIVKATRNKRRKDSRVAVVISKKIHKSAVARNRVRRRVYEVVRHELASIPQAHDIVVIVVSAELRFAENTEVTQSIKDLFGQLGLYKIPTSSDTIKDD